jgi:DNA (cytosine-5)-methyltransferase 1
MPRPRLLDLFCGAGGCSVGYYRAGFDVVGVDIRTQPNYPFEFHQADAMTFPLDGFDAVHASPPCQAFTQMSARWRGKGTKADEHLDLLTPMLAKLRPLRAPWIVENVPGARRLMANPLTLHGGMFGLGVHRPRLFESNLLLLNYNARATKQPLGVYGKPDGPTVQRYRNNGNYKGKSLIRSWKSLEEGSAAMGIDWMNVDELREAVPPAYTQFLGEQLIEQLEVAA